MTEKRYLKFVNQDEDEFDLSDVPGETGAWIGRSYADAPDVDGVVYVTGEGLTTGHMVKCEIVARRDYDLIAVAIDEPR